MGPRDVAMFGVHATSGDISGRQDSNLRPLVPRLVTISRGEREFRNRGLLRIGWNDDLSVVDGIRWNRVDIYMRPLATADRSSSSLLF
jgi:hypothetical protein